MERKPEPQALDFTHPWYLLVDWWPSAGRGGGAVRGLGVSPNLTLAPSPWLSRVVPSRPQNQTPLCAQGVVWMVFYTYPSPQGFGSLLVPWCLPDGSLHPPHHTAML